MKAVAKGRSPSRVRCRRLVLSCWAIFLAVLSGATWAADAFDIIGLRLGMTPEQALKALRAHGMDDSMIHESRRAFSYSDGLKHDYKTDDFLFKINGGKLESVGNSRKEDGISLYFSPPPDGGRLVGIERVLINNVDPVTAGQFLDALVAKYGEPAEKHGNTYRWLFGSGSKACRHYAMPDEKKGISREVYANRGTQLDLTRFRNPKVTSLGECANQLAYATGTMADRPATRVTAYMFDTQAWVNAEQASNQWVSDLAAEAAAKRGAQGQAPQL